jgi:hypothetical protein
MALEYSKIKLINMILHYVVSGMCLIMAFGTWGYKRFSRIEFILCFYYILFAVLIIFCELREKVKFFENVISYIGYLKYNFGKFGNCMFLFFLGLGRFVFNILPIIIILGIAINFIAIAFVYRQEEADDLNKDSSQQKQPDANANQPPIAQDAPQVQVVNENQA